MHKIFIAGTDTNIGKTYVSCLLLHELRQMGFKTSAIKPIASGCQRDSMTQLRNEDALRLQAAASIKTHYDNINPIKFEPPIAPHVAAKQQHLELSKQYVKKKMLSVLQADADITLLEGVGGWCVPLNEKELFSDLIAELGWPVILVVGMKLGCLNHTLLTYQHMQRYPIPLIGWIANCLSEEMLCMDENISSLQNMLNRPCLGVIPYQHKNAGQYLKMPLIVDYVKTHAYGFEQRL